MDAQGVAAHPPSSLLILLCFPLPPGSKTLQPILISQLGWWFQLGLAGSLAISITLTPCGQCSIVCKEPFTQLIALNPKGSLPTTALTASSLPCQSHPPPHVPQTSQVFSSPRVFALALLSAWNLSLTPSISKLDPQHGAPSNAAPRRGLP